MSGVFKSIGKIFKSVVKFAIKIAPYALAAAAVVFTGGAALGLLPAFGTVVGGLVSSLGLSAALTGALTGAVTSAGFGAALGFITGGKKGLQKGALMGALTGGVMGLANPAMFGITTNAAGQVTTKAAQAATQAATKGILPLDSGLTNVQPLASIDGPQLVAPELPNYSGQGIEAIQQTADTLGQAASQAGQSATQAASQGIAPLASTQPLVSGPSITEAVGHMPDYSVTPATAAPSGSSSFINQLLGGQGGVGDHLTGLVGSVLSSIGGNSDGRTAKDQRQEQEKLDQFAYGGVYAGKPNPFGIPTTPYEVAQPRFYYDKAKNEVVDRQQPQGA